jgi:hypothetical protein
MLITAPFLVHISTVYMLMIHIYLTIRLYVTCAVDKILNTPKKQFLCVNVSEVKNVCKYTSTPPIRINVLILN